MGQSAQYCRNKILPRSAQILFMIGTAVTMLVNAHSSNHEPSQEADRDPKQLWEHDSLLCEEAPFLFKMFSTIYKNCDVGIKTLCASVVDHAKGIINVDGIFSCQPCNAVVTPLRIAAAYEQCIAILGIWGD